MSLSPAEKRELLSLLATYCDRAIAPEQLRKLQTWCVNDGEARQIYLDHLFLDALLHWSLNEELGATSPSGNTGLGENPTSPLSPLSPTSQARQGVGDATISREMTGSMPVVVNGQASGLAASARLTTAEVEWFIREVPLSDLPRVPPGPDAAERTPPATASISRPWQTWGLAAALLTVMLSLAGTGWRLSRPPAAARLIAVAQPRWHGADRLELGGILQAGRFLRLDYGAVEFEFNSGATVVIRGPAEFQLLGAERLSLADGELTAHVPPQAAGFAVESAGMVITDLGTEFAVSVGPQGQARVNVLEGRVELSLARAGGRSRSTNLLAGDCLSREALGEPLVATPPPAAETLPRDIAGVRVPLPMHNTGVGLGEGDRDPHWRITRIPDDPNFVAMPATLSSDAAPYLPNAPAQDQWLSLSHNLQSAAKGVYVFEYPFEVPGEIDPATVVARARVMVDNAVRGVRLNGRETNLRTPPGRENVVNQYVDLPLEHGFVAGRNLLEFDVDNFSESRMALRVLFEASGCLAAQRLLDRTR